MQKSSGSGIGTSPYWKRRTSAGFKGPARDGFSAWGRFRLPGAAKWLRVSRARHAPSCHLSPRATLGGRYCTVVGASAYRVDAIVGPFTMSGSNASDLIGKSARSAEADRRRLCRHGRLQPPDRLGRCRNSGKAADFAPQPDRPGDRGAWRQDRPDRRRLPAHRVRQHRRGGALRREGAAAGSDP